MWKVPIILIRRVPVRLTKIKDWRVGTRKNRREETQRSQNTGKYRALFTGFWSVFVKGRREMAQELRGE